MTRPYRKQPYEVKLQSAMTRFQSRLVQHGECLLWTGYLDTKGYGRFRGPDGAKIFVHRFAYILKNGAFPDGLVTDHKCRNRSCCNPDHLEAVTNQENIARGNVGSTNREKTACPKGHIYTVENTITDSKCKRTCRQCRNTMGRIHDAKRRKAGKK